MNEIPDFDSPSFDPERSESLRSALVDVVETTTGARLRSRPRRWLGITVFAVAGIVTGGAVSGAAAAFTSSPGGPTTVAPASASSVPAPPGVMPGAPIVSLLGGVISTRVIGSEVIPLTTAPEGATHLRVTMMCLTPGITSWGPDPSGNNPSTACSADDVEARNSASYFDFALDPGTTALTIHATEGAESIVTYQFVNYVPTALGVNASGETFGSSGSGGSPDLVPAYGLNDVGESVQGFVRATDLGAFGPDWPRLPNNPDEALAWQKIRDVRYPHGWDIPLWQSDGTTQIGTVHIGG